MINRDSGGSLNSYIAQIKQTLSEAQASKGSKQHSTSGGLLAINTLRFIKTTIEKTTENNPQNPQLQETLKKVNEEIANVENAPWNYGFSRELLPPDHISNRHVANQTDQDIKNLVKEERKKVTEVAQQVLETSGAVSAPANAAAAAASSTTAGATTTTTTAATAVAAQSAPVAPKEDEESIKAAAAKNFGFGAPASIPAGKFEKLILDKLWLYGTDRKDKPLKRGEFLKGLSEGAAKMNTDPHIWPEEQEGEYIYNAMWIVHFALDPSKGLNKGLEETAKIVDGWHNVQKEEAKRVVEAFREKVRKQRTENKEASHDSKKEAAFVEKAALPLQTTIDNRLKEVAGGCDLVLEALKIMQGSK